MIPYYPPNSAHMNTPGELPVPLDAELHTRPSPGHKLWMAEGERSQSPQVQFGAWWEMEGSLWRVSWIEKTGDLFATELKATDRYMILGHFPTRKDLRQALGGWFGGNSLPALINRLDRMAHDQAQSSSG